ncbi:hypothetical protein BQ8482_490069 [Mesorhizobium delmotii]|uniref:Uncharacterized protein n=1 Tax=Mesorhizobium delmotii TaxID=1631247 RepID=A0A2P9AU82_9HYPH|nr:hypothetical protein BQ8482_490069 [Mesorhizobium delmotii]
MFVPDHVGSPFEWIAATILGEHIPTRTARCDVRIFPRLVLCLKRFPRQLPFIPHILRINVVVAPSFYDCPIGMRGHRDGRSLISDL